MAHRGLPKSLGTAHPQQPRDHIRCSRSPPAVLPAPAGLSSDNLALWTDGGRRSSLSQGTRQYERAKRFLGDVRRGQHSAAGNHKGSLLRTMDPEKHFVKADDLRQIRMMTLDSGPVASSRSRLLLRRVPGIRLHSALEARESPRRRPRLAHTSPRPRRVERIWAGNGSGRLLHTSVWAAMHRLCRSVVRKAAEDSMTTTETARSMLPQHAAAEIQQSMERNIPSRSFFSGGRVGD